MNPSKSDEKLPHEDTIGRINAELFLAVVEGDADEVRALLQKGADPHARQPSDGTTPFHLAAFQGKAWDCCKAILDHGANPNIKNNAGDTPLDCALRGRLVAIKRLRAGGTFESMFTGVVLKELPEILAAFSKKGANATKTAKALLREIEAIVPAAMPEVAELSKAGAALYAKVMRQESDPSETLRKHEYDLIRTQQIQTLVTAGIPDLVGESATDYPSSIPPLPPPPPHGDRYPFPVLCDPRITVGQAADEVLCKITVEGDKVSFESYLHQMRSAQEFLSKKECLKYSQSPYWVWCNCGDPNRGESSESFTRSAMNGERGLTATEAVFLTLHHPQATNGHNFYCPNSSHIENDAKHIILLESIMGGAFRKLDRVRPSNSHPEYGVASCHWIQPNQAGTNRQAGGCAGMVALLLLVAGISLFAGYVL